MRRNNNNPQSHTVPHPIKDGSSIKRSFVEAGEHPSGNKADDCYLRLHQIIGPDGILPISRSTFYERVKRGDLPPPIKLGDRISVWRKSDIIAFAEGGPGQ